MSAAGVGGGTPLVKDPRIAPYLTLATEGLLQQGFPRNPGSTLDYANAEASVRQLEAAGVTILAGTDAPNPGTAHGAALHRELELLVRAGLTPTEALVAATSAPAKAFRLSDRGRVAPGMKADLLLVDGDPTSDITATRSIIGIWKDGVHFDREAYARTIAMQRAQKFETPTGLDGGDVSDFEDGTLATRFGAGWTTSTDQQAAGKSTAQLSVVSGGANGSARALSVSGTISSELAYAWAGAMFSPGTQPMQAADLSSKKELRFWARGDGKTYRVMLFAMSRGFLPLTQSFVAGPEWRQYAFPLSSFGGIDGHDLRAVLFAGGPAPGPFAFRIDDVQFR